VTVAGKGRTSAGRAATIADGRPAGAAQAGATPDQTTATAPPGTAPDAPAAPRTRGMRSVLVSTFGMFMLVVVLCSIGNNRLTSQLANVMPHAFGFSNTATSLLLGAAGLLNIPVIVLTGSWLVHARAVDICAPLPLVCHRRRHGRPGAGRHLGDRHPGRSFGRRRGVFIGGRRG